jgi:hypothetical protein
MRIRKIASILGATALGLGLSLTGALAANAVDITYWDTPGGPIKTITLPPVPAHWYTDSTQCAYNPDTPHDGTVQLPPPTADFRFSSTDWGVPQGHVVSLTVIPLHFSLAMNAVSSYGYEIATHKWVSPLCPQPTEAPTTPPPAAPVTQQQTVTVTPKTQTTTKSTVTASTATAPKSEAPATDTPATVTTPTTAPTTEATTAPTTEPETLTATPASSATPDGNLIIPIGGAALIAGALTTLGIGIGKLGWFRH